jgi:hypothetical protein
MKNRYFDFESIPIDENKIAQHSDYYKAHLDEDNEYKLIESIEENQLVAIDYYLGKEESVEAVLENFKEIDQITFFTKKENRGIYNKFEVITYFQNVRQNVIRLQVFKDLLLPIYDFAADTTTNQLVSFSKNLYDLENKLHYEFEYESTGELKQITVYDPKNYVDTSNFTILPHQVGKQHNDYGFDWQGFEYYQNAQQVFPE